MAKKRAGFVPYRVVGGEILMMFMVPSYSESKHKMPQCCKGKIEAGETEKDAAMREGLEELGLFKNNLKSINRLTVTQDTTVFFCGEVIDETFFTLPCTETLSTVWMDLEEYRKYGRQDQLHIVESVDDIARRP